MPNDLEAARRVERVLEGVMEGRAVILARRLGLFDALAERPATCSQLAERLQLAQKLMVGKLARILETTGWIERDGDLLSLSACSRLALLTDGDEDFSAVLDFFADQFETKDTGSLADFIRTARPLRPRVTPEQWQRYMRAMENISRHSADAIARSIDLTNASRLLDLAGGPGHYSAAFCKIHPNLDVTLLDLEPALPIAAQNLNQAGYGERVDLRSGSITDFDYGHGFDVVFLSHTIHLFGEEDVQRIFAACYQALKSPGRLVVRDVFVEDGRPELGALVALNMWIEGDAYSPGSVTTWMQQAGFTEVTQISCCPETGPQVLGSLIGGTKQVPVTGGKIS